MDVLVLADEGFGREGERMMIPGGGGGGDVAVVVLSHSLRCFPILFFFGFN